MRRTMLIRTLIVSAVGLALVAGAIAAVASTRDSEPDTSREQSRQESTPAPEAETPWLGIVAQPFKDGDGVAIEHVAPGSPADDAGLEAGDVIRAIDGTDVQDVEDLRSAIEEKGAGDEVTLSVVKNGVEDDDAEASDVKVTLEARQAKEGLRCMLDDQLGETFDRFLGGSFKYLDENGDEVTIEAVPGSVKSVSDTELKIDVNGNEGDRSFELPEAARVPDDLSEGDRVTVVLKDGEVQGVHPGVFGIMGGMLPGLDGFPMPFKRGGLEMPFREFGPHHDGSFGDCMPNQGPEQDDSEPDA